MMGLRSIHRKLIAVIVLSCVVSLVAAGVAIVIYELSTFRPRVLNSLDAQVDLLAANVVAPLQFRLVADAEDALAMLKAYPEVVAAAGYLSDGTIFAKYQRASTKEFHFPTEIKGRVSRFVGNHLFHYKPLILEREVVGYLFVDYELPTVLSRVLQYGIMFGFIFFALAVVSVIFSASLKQVIIEPVLALSNIATRVKTEENYSLRAQKRWDDEIGGLTDAFNQMLDTIEESSAALKGERQTLAARVRELNLLFQMSELTGLAGVTTDVFAREISLLLPRAFQYSDLAVARLVLQGKEFMSVPELPTEISLSRAIRVRGRQSGMVEVFYKAMPSDSSSTDPFLPEEHSLLEVVAERLGALIDRSLSDKERETLEKQLRHAQKLETLGTLAGGIAHDFNNILTPILGHLQVAMLNPQLIEGARENVEYAIQGATRAAALVKQILVFSGKAEQELMPIEVQHVISETLKLVRATLPSTIEIETEMDPECSPTWGDPTRIHQILMNLVTNAFHAMREKGGVLKVRLDMYDVTREFSRLHYGFQEGRYLRLSVSDSGYGMNQATKDRLFEPFFSTKPVGEGSGLGLSVVHGIVHSLGGAVLVDSELGKGSTFQIFLPEARVAAAKAVTSHDYMLSLRGTERVLYVDDEESIVSVAKQLFSHFGYAITITTSSKAALQSFESAPDAYDLVITDQTMPQMTGLELAAAVHALRPETPIILATGYSERVTPDSLLATGVSSCLMKPFDMAKLVGTVRRSLDERKKLRLVSN